MNILVTGANGQLGRELYDRQGLARASSEFYFTDKEDLDITQKGDVEKFIDNHAIDTVINCAAYTDVDGAESHQQAAWQLNEAAVGNLARLAADRNLRLIHISTDYVFDGTNHRPYREDDEPNPHSVYGKSKLAGEQHITRNNAGMIIRTAWLYSTYGKNFVKTISRLVKEKEELKVVCDQVGNPTYAGDLAMALLQIINVSEEMKELTGIYHFANEGVCSWYDFALEIARLQDASCRIHPIESKDWPTPAPRPHYSVFNKKKIKDRFLLRIPHWRESLERTLQKM